MSLALLIQLISFLQLHNSIIKVLFDPLPESPIDRVMTRVSELTPRLATWPLRGHRALKSFLWQTVFLDRLRDFSLLSLNSFFRPFLKSKFM